TLERLYDDLIEQISSEQDEIVGDVGRAEELLTGVIPEEQVADIISDVRGVSNQFVWRRLPTLPEKAVAEYLLAEHPQTVATILSNLDPAYAASLLTHLPDDLMNQVMRRMLLSKPISDAALRVVETTLQEDLFVTANAPTSAEVNSRVAGIINRLDREQMEKILDEITACEPLVAAQLKNLVFSFDDIVKLSERARMVIFDQLPTERVIVALRGADTALREAVLPCLSARTRRMVEAELASPNMPPKRDIVAAQREISAAVLRMAEQGLFELGQGADSPQAE
ncbi:MAG: flagellar motor switch protein FliG, partial [Methylocystis sp.]|nr:flagellar motor switch protein FliG [Methylocystis sp.]